MGRDTLNVNHRMLLVLIKTSRNYSLLAQNTNFIPTENDVENTCLSDPLQETGAVSIKNGVLILSYHIG
jgi:hypothetical protein